MFFSLLFFVGLFWHVAFTLCFGGFSKQQRMNIIDAINTDDYSYSLTFNNVYILFIIGIHKYVRWWYFIFAQMAINVCVIIVSIDFWVLSLCLWFLVMMIMVILTTRHKYRMSNYIFIDIINTRNTKIMKNTCWYILIIFKSIILGTIAKWLQLVQYYTNRMSCLSINVDWIGNLCAIDGDVISITSLSGITNIFRTFLTCAHIVSKGPGHLQYSSYYGCFCLHHSQIQTQTDATNKTATGVNNSRVGTAAQEESVND